MAVGADMEQIAITVELGTHYGWAVVMRVILIGTTIGIGAPHIVKVSKYQKVLLFVRITNVIV